MGLRGRVLQGMVGQAGQAWALSEALKAEGFASEVWVDSSHAFNFQADRRVASVGHHRLAPIMAALGPRLREFDIVHFHTRTATRRSLIYPCLIDLCLLRAAGKKVFVHFRGTEVRTAAEFKAGSPYHYCADLPAGFTPRQDAAKREYVRLVEAMASGVFVVDDELKTYVPTAQVVPRLIDDGRFPFVGASSRSVPIIVHAPSDRKIKGSDWVISALDRLRSEGVRFDLRLVEGMSHDDAAQAYRDADIVVDQMRIGWYGVLAVEAMALGKPVVAYIREDLWRDDLPIVNANRDNLGDKLRELILSRSRGEIGARSRQYYERVHAPPIVARHLADIYAGADREFDLQVSAEYFDALVSNHGRFSQMLFSAERAGVLLRNIGIVRTAKHLIRAVFR